MQNWFIQFTEGENILKNRHSRRRPDTLLSIMAHHATKQILRPLSFCCCPETPHAGHVQAEGRPPSIVLQLKSVPVLQPGATLRGTPSPAAFPLPSPPLPAPLLHSSVCQAQLVNRSPSRPASCFQHMGAWRRGSHRAAPQTGEKQVWSCLQINR